MTESIRGILARSAPGGEVTVRGWIRTARHSKQVSFFEVSDGSCFSGLQVVVDPSLPNFEAELRHLGTGCAVVATGELVASQGKGQQFEVAASAVEVVGTVGDDYPLQKKRHSFEFLRTIAHLRPRTNTIGAVWRVRNAVSFAIHRFFQERGFLYLHTPVITASDAEGAGELFRVTTEGPEEFFGRQAFLTVSGQLEAEIGALALTNVYTFGPTFRAENSNTSRHAAEFWMIEPEMAWYDLEDNCNLAEDFVKYLLRTALDRCSEDLAFFNQRIDKGLIARLEQVASDDFARITYTEAIERLTKSKQKFEFPVAWGKGLQAEHERYLTEVELKRPVFMVDQPAGATAFYMRRNDDGKTVAAMDLLGPKVG